MRNKKPLEWIAIYTDILIHEKTIAIAEELNITVSQAFMYMGTLMIAVGRDSPDGRVDKMTPKRWKNYLDWPNRPSAEAVFQALLKTNFVGKGARANELVITGWNLKQPSVVKRLTEQNKYDTDNKPDNNDILRRTTPNKTSSLRRKTPEKLQTLERERERERERENNKALKAKDVFDVYCEIVKKSNPAYPKLPIPDVYDPYYDNCRTRAAFFNKHPNEYLKFKKAVELMANEKDKLEWYKSHVNIIWFIKNNTNYTKVIEWFDKILPENSLSPADLKRQNTQRIKRESLAIYAERYPDRVERDYAGKLEPADTFIYRNESQHPEYVEELREIAKEIK